MQRSIKMGTSKNEIFYRLKRQPKTNWAHHTAVQNSTEWLTSQQKSLSRNRQHLLELNWNKKFIRWIMPSLSPTKPLQTDQAHQRMPWQGSVVHATNGLADWAFTLWQGCSDDQPNLHKFCIAEFLDTPARTTDGPVQCFQQCLNYGYLVLLLVSSNFRLTRPMVACCSNAFQWPHGLAHNAYLTITCHSIYLQFENASRQGITFSLCKLSLCSQRARSASNVPMRAQATKRASKSSSSQCALSFNWSTSSSVNCSSVHLEFNTLHCSITVTRSCKPHSASPSTWNPQSEASNPARLTKSCMLERTIRSCLFPADRHKDTF